MDRKSALEGVERVGKWPGLARTEESSAGRQCWRIPLIPGLGRQRQADLCEFKASLGNKASSETTRAVTQRNPVSKNRQAKIIKIVQVSSWGLSGEEGFRSSDGVLAWHALGSVFSTLILLLQGVCVG